MSDDRHLLDAWRGGETAAGRELFDRYFALICRFFRSKVEMDADDLVQQTFERCLKSREKVRDGTQFRAYLLAIARSVMVDHMRKRARSPEMVEADLSCADELEPSPSWLAHRKREYQLLLRALRKIPLDAQILLELSYWEQLSSRELSEIFDVPAPTIRSRVQKARTLLHTQLANLSTSPTELSTSFRGLQSWAQDMRAQLLPDSE